MRNYETMLILDPSLEPDQLEKETEKIKQLISSDGEVLSVDEWGRRELAYEIDKHTEGYYIVIQFKAKPEVSLRLNREIKMNRAILRGMVVREED